MKKRSVYKVFTLLLTVVMIFGLCACGVRKETIAPPIETQVSTPEPTSEPTPEPTPEPIIGEVLTDDDGDGIINYKFHYKGATVYALIVLDPSRVFIGTALPNPGDWGSGLTLDVMAEQYGAVAGINAGGFIDVDGGGSGWPPSGITYSHGVNFNGEQYGPIAGLDRNDQMWAGWYDYNDCENIGIRDAVCFGPALVRKGKKTDPAKLESGIGARTMIGQREDGAVVMVVIDGRQGYSIGVTFKDCVDIMAEKFGCINAANMDGGNSSCMYYAGQAVNRSANQAGGTRYLPDAWLVNALPDNYMKPEDVPDRIILPENPLGEEKEYLYECDQETCDRMYAFACAFAEMYYGFFGTKNSEYYYYSLLQYGAQDCELRTRMDLALLDRKWVNTWRTDANNIVLNGAYANGDGTYDIVITSDICEYSDYWNYEAPGTSLRITVVEAPDSAYGYLATATF